MTTRHHQSSTSIMVRRLWSMILVIGLIGNIYLISKTSWIHDHHHQLLLQSSKQDFYERPIGRIIIESLPSKLRELPIHNKYSKPLLIIVPETKTEERTPPDGEQPPPPPKQQQRQQPQPQRPPKMVNQNQNEPLDIWKQADDDDDDNLKDEEEDGTTSIPKSQSKSAATNNNNNFFSVCLLIKDDNAILNEWIAYHYHVMNLRYMIVAVDPTSQMSPVPILETWRKEFGMTFELWQDADYLPDYFLQGQYELLPRMIKMEDKNATKWQDITSDNSNTILSEEHLHQDYLKINSHRYRQAKFLQHCSKRLQDQKTSSNNNHNIWMTHIDTDEYIVRNPTLLPKPKAGLQANSLWNMLQELVPQDKVSINWPCISMPRVLYGSVEDDNDVQLREQVVVVPAVTNSATTPISATFSRSKMETLRWKYHADYFNTSLNKQPKVIMDVSGFPPFNSSKKAFSIHRPSMKLCRTQAQMNVNDPSRYPLTVNHYLGSLQRYTARDDPRRASQSGYWQKALIRDGSDDDWMDTWLTSFVQEHGVQKVSHVLGSYMTTTIGQDVNNDNTAADHHDNPTPSSNHKPLDLGRTLPLEQDSFSACLLVKDDNDILNEWIAYHYHVLKLRTLIVASDPTGRTSPSIVFERWKPFMDIYEWTDDTYMPDFFLQQQYHLVPNMMGNHTTTNTTSSTLAVPHHGDDNDDDAATIQQELLQQQQQQVNNHRFRQASFFYSCVKDLREQKNKTWVMHIDSDEYVVLHHEVRKQTHWRNISSFEPEIAPNSILKFLKQAANKYPKALSYPCISMPRLLYGSKEEEEVSIERENSPRSSRGSFPTITDFHPAKFETLRWKYHTDYDNEIKWNGRPKVILDLSGLPPSPNFLRPSKGVFSIHRPGLFMCRGDKGVVFDKKFKFPLTVNHYLGSWERYSHRSDARRSRETYDAKANVAAGKDDDWIDAWVPSFVKEHGLETATRLLAEYTQDDYLNRDDEGLANLELLPMITSGDNEDEEGAVPNNNNPQKLLDNKNPAVKIKPESLKTFDASKHMEFSACLLVKDDNDILNEWIAYHYHVLGLRYIIVSVDAKSQTSPSPLLERWRNDFGMTIEEWNDEMFMPAMYFQKAYHLQPRLVKFKKNKHKWFDGIDDPEVARKYFYTIQDHRFRQITFLSACTKKLREQNRTWMVHIDSDEYIVINPKLRKLPKLGEHVTVPTTSVEPSIVPRLLNQMVVHNWETVNYPCISLPRLLYGSIYDDDTSEHQQSNIHNNVGFFNVSRFESLRWKYHAAFDDSSLNKQPKVIMDVSAIPPDDKMLTEGRVFSIHRPSQYLCRTQGQMNFDSVEYYPFSVNHYLGTFERFGARDDPRRNEKLYHQKAGVRAGKDDDWINGWLSGFLEKHGSEKVSNVLQDYMIRK